MVIPTSSRGPNPMHSELAYAIENPSCSGLPFAAGGVLHLKRLSFRSPLALRWRFARSLGMLLSILAAIALGNIMALPAAASPALVQHASKDAGTTLSSSLAFPLNNTAGNWVGVIIRAGFCCQRLAREYISPSAAVQSNAGHAERRDCRDLLRGEYRRRD